MNLASEVAQNLSALGYSPDLQHPDIQKHIIQYLLLIEKWNKHYNLTAIKTIEDMLYQHIMDSFATVTHLNGPQVVDVGTGAGLPGIPLAIARPDWQVTLIESNRKKTAFLQQAKIELKLDNIVIIPKRVEKTEIDGRINTLISRAYASLGDFIKSTAHLVKSNDKQCRWIAMKSYCSNQELEEVVVPYHIEQRIPLNVPGLSAKRELIIIKRIIKPAPSEISIQ